MKKLLTLLILPIMFVSLFPVSASAETNGGVGPNSFLYFFDTTFEKIGLLFTFDSEKKAQKALVYAEERLAEAEESASQNKPKAVEKAMEDYEKKISLATEKSKELDDEEKAEKLLNTVSESTARHQEVLADVLEKVPDEAKEAILNAIEVSKQGHEKALEQIAELQKEVGKLKEEIEDLKEELEEKEKSENEKSENKQSNSSSDVIKQKPLNLDSYKIDELEKDKAAEQYTRLLISIKNEIDALNNAGLEVKQRMVDSEIKISNFRIEKLNALADLSPLEIITKTYEELIAIEEIRKKNTSFFLSDTLLDTYLYSLEVGKIITTLETKDDSDIFVNAQRIIDQHQERIGVMKEKSEAVIESTIAENRVYAQEFLLRMESTNSLADRYSSALSVLQEIEEAKKEIERIITSEPQESYYIPTYFSTNETKQSTGNLSCKYPKDKYILVPGKGWQAVKQCDNGTYIEADKYKPDTSAMTPQQICDMRKSAWLGQDALILPGPDCSDLGL